MNKTMTPEWEALAIMHSAHKLSEAERSATVLRLAQAFRCEALLREVFIFDGPHITRINAGDAMTQKVRKEFEA